MTEKEQFKADLDAAGKFINSLPSPKELSYKEKLKHSTSIAKQMIDLILKYHDTEDAEILVVIGSLACKIPDVATAMSFATVGRVLECPKPNSSEDPISKGRIDPKFFDNLGMN